MAEKKIAIVHYHLKRGGVTTVIREQVAALRDRDEVLVVTGEPPEERVHDRVAVIPGLGYGGAGEGEAGAERLAAALAAAVERQFGGRCDVLHFHNPILGKNHHLLRAIGLLAGRGWPVFLQIHDFAEDGRPGSCSREEYPADVHYGVINSRDHAYLLDSGLRGEGVHLLPNAVREMALAGGDPGRNRLYLYPVRAIRRKNLGEALLLSLFLEEDDSIGVTLPALSRSDVPSYEDWKLFAREERLRVSFDLGTERDFTELTGSAKAFLTTSVAEGFGFAFLEPWLAGRMLWGRRLDGICDDFTASGLSLGHLYDRLSVPLSLVDRERLAAELKAELRHLEKYYGAAFGADEAVAAAFADGEWIDFGMLPEKDQARIIRTAAADPGLRRAIGGANPQIAALVRNEAAPDLIERNRRAVRGSYSREGYGLRLAAVYDKVARGPVRQRIDKLKLLSRFLKPQHLSLLKWGRYDGA